MQSTFIFLHGQWLVTQVTVMGGLGGGGRGSLTDVTQLVIKKTITCLACIVSG